MSSFYTSVERMGSNILWRGYKDGRHFSKKVAYQPTLFIPTKNETQATHRSLVGNIPLQPKKFESMNEAKDFLEKYKEVRGFDIYGMTNFVPQFIQEQYPNDIEFDINLINIVSFDIEYDSTDGFSARDDATKEIISISYKSSKRSEYHLLALKDFDISKSDIGVPHENIVFQKFNSEAALLNRFIQLWVNDYPDVITGWNVEFFDIFYIITRITKVLGEAKAKELSPWGIIRKRTTEMFNRQQSTFDIYGVAVIDYMDAFKKFGYKYGPQESYKLDHISSVVLGEKKVDYSEYGTLAELWIKNPQLFLDYSLKDTVLIQQMEDETGLIGLVLEVAYGGGVNYQDAFGTVGIWESILYRWQMSRNIVPPIKGGPGETTRELVGGFVKDPKPGLYDWIVSFDLNSLYPHLMMQYNMSPETYIQGRYEPVSIDMVLEGKYKNETEYAVAANGVCFSKEKQGMIPTIVKEFYGERSKVKKKMLSIEQEMEQIKHELKERGISV